MKCSVSLDDGILASGHVVLVAGHDNKVALASPPIGNIPETEHPSWFVDKEDKEFCPSAWRDLQLCRLPMHEGPDWDAPTQVYDAQGNLLRFDWDLVMAARKKVLHLRGHPGIGRTTALVQLAWSLPEPLFPVYIDCSLEHGALRAQGTFRDMTSCTDWARVLTFLLCQERYASRMVLLLDNFVPHAALVAELQKMAHVVITVPKDGSAGRGWEVAALSGNCAARQLPPAALEADVQLCRNRLLLKQVVVDGLDCATVIRNGQQQGVILPSPDQYQWLVDPEKLLSLVSAVHTLRLPFLCNWRLRLRETRLDQLCGPSELSVVVHRGLRRMEFLRFVEGLFRRDVSIYNVPPPCYRDLSSSVLLHMVECWRDVLLERMSMSVEEQFLQEVLTA
jgi:hypothetical protein